MAEVSHIVSSSPQNRMHSSWNHENVGRIVSKKSISKVARQHYGLFRLQHKVIKEAVRMSLTLYGQQGR